MASKRHAILALAVVGVFVVSAFAPVGAAQSIKRLVWPSAVTENWIPVIAGYKVEPNEVPCNHGTPSGNVLYSNSFDNGFGAMQLVAGTAGPHPSNLNIFHVTTFTGVGTEQGHSAGNRVYWGVDTTNQAGHSGWTVGTFHTGFQENTGTLALDFDVPAGTTQYFLSFNTKWETEWLEGYDHMWVEALPVDGHIYILCQLNPEGRGDPSSSETESLGSCSPYDVVAIVCPHSAKRIIHDGIPYNALDPDSPHWEARTVPIPVIWNGQHVQLRFTFDSADGVSNTYLGWMLDDVTISDAIVPVPTALPIVTGIVG